jgi:hypothetical protein
MSTLKVQGVTYESGAMTVVMQLEDCVLRDMRRLEVDTGHRISDLLSLKGSREKIPMLQLNYNQSVTNQTLKCKVSGFTLVLCLDYLLMVSDFFVSSIPKKEQTPVGKAKSARSKTNSRPSSGKTQIKIILKFNLTKSQILQLNLFLRCFRK